jgi:adenosylcobinamide-GDP ribazoletransferase
MPDTAPQPETTRPIAPPTEPLLGWSVELRIALSTFTCLPVRPQPQDVAVAPVAAVRALPIVGLVIGLAAAIVYAAADFFGVSSAIAALLAVATMTAMGRGLHESGLAVATDALTGRTHDQASAIMRPHGIGALGILALIFVQSLRVTALSQAGGALDAALMLIVAASGSRAAMSTVLYLLPPASAERSDWADGHPDRRRVVDAAALGVLIALALLWPAWWAAMAIATAAAASAATAWLVRRRLAGRSGDALGAVQQVTETAILVVYVASPSWF